MVETNHFSKSNLPYESLQLDSLFFLNDEWGGGVKAAGKQRSAEAPFNMAPVVTMDTSISWTEVILAGVRPERHISLDRHIIFIIS